MTNLTIYNSNGQKYTANGVESASDSRIESFFFAGVKLAVTGGSRPEVIAFFRAKERAGGRSEQFYAVYEATQQQNNITNLKRELRSRVEDEWGLTIDENASDMDVFRELDNPRNDLPGSDFQHEVINELLRQHQKVEFGVSNVSQAVTMLAKHYLSGDADSFAISNEGRTEVLNNYALVVSPGGYNGLTPLGGTSQQMEHARASKREQLVQQKIRNVKSDISDIKQNSNLSDAEIRRKLTQQIPLLKSNQSTTSDNYSTTSSSSYSSSSTHSSSSEGLVSKALPIAVPAVLVIAALVVTYLFIWPYVSPMVGLGNAPFDDADLNTDYAGQSISVRMTNVSGDMNMSEVSVNVTNSDGAEVPLQSDLSKSRDNISGTLSPETKLSAGDYTVNVGYRDDTKSDTLTIEPPFQNAQLSATSERQVVSISMSQIGPVAEGESLTVLIENSSGSEVASQSFTVTNGNLSGSVSLEGNAPGEYTVVVVSDEYQTSTSVVVNGDPFEDSQFNTDSTSEQIGIEISGIKSFANDESVTVNLTDSSGVVASERFTVRDGSLSGQFTTNSSFTGNYTVTAGYGVYETSTVVSVEASSSSSTQPASLASQPALTPS